MKRVIAEGILITIIFASSSIFVFFSLKVVPASSAHKDTAIIKDENSDEQCNVTCPVIRHRDKYLVAYGRK